jgi:hypothetical protein
MNRGARVLLLAAFLTGIPFSTLSAGGGPTVGPNANADVYRGCVDKGGFIVNVIFWIFDPADFDACIDMGDHPMGVWDANFYAQHDGQVPGNHNGQLK